MYCVSIHSHKTYSVKVRLTWGDVDAKLDLHVDQCAVLGRPRPFQYLKHCARRLAQHVQFHRTDGHSRQCETNRQYLLLGPLRVVICIVLQWQNLSQTWSGWPQHSPSRPDFSTSISLLFHYKVIVIPGNDNLTELQSELPGKLWDETTWQQTYFGASLHPRNHTWWVVTLFYNLPLKLHRIPR